jgi:hypothetical protein
MYYSCTFQYVHIYLYLIYAYRVRNNTPFIIENPITMDSIIFVGIDFPKLKKKWQVVDTPFRGLWNSTRSSFIE